MTTFISAISHHNSADIITGLRPERLKAGGNQVIILDNVPETAMEEHCAQHQLHYLANKQVHGFGSNHNRVFRHCRDQLGMTDDDYFVILNPDLECEPAAIDALVSDMQTEGAAIGAPNIFKDAAFTQHEESVRRFPYIWEVFTSFLFKKNRTGVDRCSVRACEIDWGSGACLAFKAGVFEQLGGFDERYFLYYEDVDLCWRARHKLGIKAYYFPHAKVVHRGQRASHTLNNKHLWWHLSSALRFSWVRVKTFFGRV